MVVQGKICISEYPLFKLGNKSRHNAYCTAPLTYLEAVGNINLYDGSESDSLVQGSQCSSHHVNYMKIIICKNLQHASICSRLMTTNVMEGGAHVYQQILVTSFSIAVIFKLKSCCTYHDIKVLISSSSCPITVQLIAPISECHGSICLYTKQYLYQFDFFLDHSLVFV